MDEFLRKVPLFKNLSDEDFERICGVVQEIDLPAGEELFPEGSPGDRAYVIKAGQLEILKASEGREVLLAVRGSGEVIGEFALIEKAPRMATVRARDDSQLIVILQEQFDELLKTSASAARAMLDVIFERLRANEARLLQSEKMAQLGTLSAGVAHELNNPAAAVKRGSDQLQETIEHIEEVQARLYSLDLNDEQRGLLKELIAQVKEMIVRPPELDSLTRSDREQALEDWLETQGVRDTWKLAPTLVDLDYDVARLQNFATQFESRQFPDVVDWLCTSYVRYSLLTEIGQGASRISEIVKALKTYSYLDQAPVQTVDIHDGLESTLVILRHKLKPNIQVKRKYAPDLPLIQTYASELNQVWTNILDNAADAMNGQGEITIRTYQNGDWVIVEIEDNGPGIPEELQRRVFDAFFTTKPPGQGTGLGLDISYNIVVLKHRGDIQLYSQPGKTCFQVWLPLSLES